MDSAQDYPRGDIADQPAVPTQVELEAAFDQDESDVTAGRVAAPEPVLARMRAIAERIRRERDLRKATTPRRA